MSSLIEKMFFAVLELQWTWKWKIVHIDMTYIDRGLDMDTNILNITMRLIYIKQHLSNIWSSIQEKVKEQFNWFAVEISFPYILPTLALNGLKQEMSLIHCHTPAGNNMFKVNNRNTRTRYEISSKLTIKIPERRGVVLVPLLLTLSIFYTLL